MGRSPQIDRATHHHPHRATAHRPAPAPTTPTIIRRNPDHTPHLKVPDPTPVNSTADSRVACTTGPYNSGLLALRPRDLDADQCPILLREKGGTVRWQPVSPTLMTHLQRHAQQRNAPPDGRLLRYRNGRPITYRRYDHLWQRIGKHLPWVATQGISTHWLRHTTLTWVERTFSHTVARAYAGHTDNSGQTGATHTYVRASVQEVATALSALTGEPHPLADDPGSRP